MKTYQRIIGGAIAVVFTTSSMLGCASASRTQQGAGTGAVVGGIAGGIIGHQSGRGLEGAAIGAAGGALVGAGIGHMLQKQKESLQRINELEVREQQVALANNQPITSVTVDPNAPSNLQRDALLLTLQGDVLFEVGSSNLTQGGAYKVREVAAVLREYPESDVLVRGFTSSEGTDQGNFELSQRRAQVVRNELIANSVAASRVTAQGMGSSHPVASNATEAGRAMNRRVELTILPRG